MVVALSGGGDSTALLHLLRGIGAERELTLLAAHFDHGLRPGSAAEAERVADSVRSVGIALRVGCPASRLPADQASLREARYEFLEDVADEVGAERVATAHQADDQAETVLFRVLRGSGLAGLAGIPARRRRIVRPLLPFGRHELRSWLSTERISWLEDPSNEDSRWARPRIREEVLPAAEAAWGEGLPERLRELGAAASRADASLEARARGLVREARTDPPRHGWRDAVALSRPVLLEAAPELRGRAVRRIARDLGVRMTGGGTRQANQFVSAGLSGGRVDLGGGVVLAREFDRFVLGRPAPASPDAPLVLEPPEAGRARMHAGGRSVRVSWSRGWTDSRGRAGAPGEDGDPGGGTGGALLAADRLALPLRVRSWSDGDRFGPDRRGRKLKEIFRERRVPASQRSRLVLAEDSRGRIAWVEGVGPDPELVPEAGDRALSLRVEDA